jgi:UDP-N-acetylmuramoylalanine--D-glutamate ligase
VLELSSFQLEYADENSASPHIAVITNIYNDHLNRYGKFDVYAKMKFNIFRNQTADDFLILNADEDITKEILKKKPKSKIYYVSHKPLPKNMQGLYFSDNSIYLKHSDGTKMVLKKTGFSRHEKANLLCALLCAHLSNVSWEVMKTKLHDLPIAPLRQEIIVNNNKLKVVNDSAGTSPDATIAAIEKFGEEDDFVLISGGTDKDLDFSALAEKINDNVPPKNLYLLTGNGTDKLVKELKNHQYVTKNIHNNLAKLVKEVAKNHETGTIVFSPGGASFEKFKNEYDRGRKFNLLARKYFIDKKGKIS